MNMRGKALSLVYAFVLLECAFFAGYDDFAFAFAIGDDGAPTSIPVRALLIGTLVGAAGLAIASLGSWTRWRAVSLTALVSAVVVFPAAILYGWQSSNAMWNNSHHGMHYGPPLWTAAILPPVLDLAAVAFSWVRLRKLAINLPATPDC